MQLEKHGKRKGTQTRAYTHIHTESETDMIPIMSEIRNKTISSVIHWYVHHCISYTQYVCDARFKRIVRECNKYACKHTNQQAE